MVLTVENLSVSFRSIKALNQVSFGITSGIYGLVGENGAGKTTLFRSLLGLQQYSGTIQREGITHVGYVPQKFESLKDLNLTDTLLYFTCLQNIPRKMRAGIVEDALESVNLTEDRSKKVQQLSGGMLRRLGIAQALINNPELLIMDEPTAGLDPTERLRFREIIEKIAPNRIILISTHEIHELEHICKQMLFLHKGQLVCMDTLENLSKSFQTTDMEEVYFRLIQGEAI